MAGNSLVVAHNLDQGVRLDRRHQYGHHDQGLKRVRTRVLVVVLLASQIPVGFTRCWPFPRVKCGR